MSAVDVLACFACGKKFRNLDSRYLVDTRDGQEVFVGPECFRHVQSSGAVGYQPPNGGPRLWPLSVAGVLADMDSCCRDLPGEQSEILCQARAAVAELMAKSRDMEIAANGVAYCYSKNPARFAENLQYLSEAAAEYRAALARCKGGAK